MLKMVMVIYNEAIDLEVMEMLRKCAVVNYTKITAAFGKGATSGTHLGNDIWPGRNNILFVTCEEKQPASCWIVSEAYVRRWAPKG